jgi:hypothetical protein
MSMFGMLDYRAHKLYWLLALPFRVIVKILFLAVIFVAILTAHSTANSKPIQIVIAYTSFLVGLNLLNLILLLITSAFTHVFFWLIDVAPSHGADIEEAYGIVLFGRAAELVNKFDTNIDGWTYADTRELVSRTIDWRTRLLFCGTVMQRAAALVQELRTIHGRTGKQPRDMGQSEIEKIRNQLPNGKPSWCEEIVGPLFPTLVALVLIVAIIGLA